jgi:citrate lyase beta subunit
MDISFLYTPALRIDSLLNKKDSIFPSRIIVDLEDSVHIRAKEQARRHVAEFDFTELAAAGFRFGMRVNPISSYDGIADLALIKELRGAGKTHIEYVLAPKVLHPNEVGIYRSLLNTLPNPPKIYSFIETMDAVDNADAIAAVSDGLCFGQADLAAEMYAPNAAFIDYARARLCLAASRHRIAAIDTNSFDVKNMDAVHKECTIAKAYGFTGKAAIHPDQVAAINNVFSVSSAAVEKFQSSIAAYESAATGFAIRDGEVIAPPFITKARRMLAFYESQSKA